MRRSFTRLVGLPLLLSLGFLACKKEAAAPAPAEAPKVAPAPTAAAAPAEVKGRVEVEVTEAGFVPARIPAKAGVPVTLAITRKTEQTCATEIMFAGDDKKTELPVGKTVEVTYTPKQSGDVKFGCAMGMMIGGVLAVSN